MIKIAVEVQRAIRTGALEDQVEIAAITGVEPGAGAIVVKIERGVPGESRPNERVVDNRANPVIGVEITMGAIVGVTGGRAISLGVGKTAQYK